MAAREGKILILDLMIMNKKLFLCVKNQYSDAVSGEPIVNYIMESLS